MNDIINFLLVSSVYIFIIGIILIVIRALMKSTNCRNTSIYQLWFLFLFGLMSLIILQFTNLTLPMVSEMKILVLPSIYVTAQKQNEIISVQTIVLVLWVLVVLFLLSSLVYKYFNFKKSLHTNVSLLDKNICKSDFVKNPMAFGVLFPCVYLPYNSHKIFTKEQQQLLIDHELIHCKRFDPLLRMIYKILESIYFFHPMIYILNNIMKFDQEVSVDQLVLDKTNENKLKIEYSKLLLQINQNKGFKSDQILPEHYCSSISMLKERIMLINNRKSTSKNILNRMTGAALILTAITAVAVTTTALADNSNTKQSSAPMVIPKPPKVNGKMVKVPKPPKVHKAHTNGTDIEIIPIVRVAPNYPRKAAMEKITGYVTMDIDIAPNGRVKDVRVVESEPKDIFDVEAVKSVMKYKFAPIAQTVTIQQKVEFKLN